MQTGEREGGLGSRAPVWLYVLMVAATSALLPAAFAGQETAPVAGNSRASLSLNGTWKIAFDTENVGKEQQWYKHFSSAAEPIHVPSVWNEIRPNYQGVAWYQTSFVGPSSWKGDSVRIAFDAVSYLERSG